MSRLNRNQVIISALLVVTNVILLNIIVDQFRAPRIDLTEGQIFGLSETTEKILENLREPVEILAYISAKEAMSPDIRPLIPELKDLLDEYAIKGGEKVRLRYIVPEDDELAESEARDSYGIKPEIGIVRDERKESIQAYYLSLVVKYPGAEAITVNAQELVARNLLRGSQELELKNVELAVTKAIKRSVRGFESKKNIFKKFPSKLEIITFVTPEEALPEALREGAAGILETIDDLAARSGGKLVHERADLTNEALISKYQPPAFVISDSDEPLFLSMIIRMEGEFAPVRLVDYEGVRDKLWVEKTIMAQVKRSSPGLLRRIGIAEHFPPVDQRGRQQYPPAYAAVSQLIGQDHEVLNIDLNDLEALPADLDLLLVMGPKKLGETAAYVIDQYVMGGGKAIFCVDRTESSVLVHQDTIARASDSGLETMLAGWGLNLEAGVLLDPDCGEFNLAQRRSERLLEGPVQALVEIGLDDAGVNRELGFMKSFEIARFWFPGALRLDEVGGLEATWLLRSSDQAFVRSADPELKPDLLAHPKGAFAAPGGEEKRGRRVVAALVEGVFPSAWAGKKAPRIAPAAEDEEEDQLALSETPIPSSAPTRVVVIANSEFVDLLQAQISRQAGSRYSLFPSNMDFILNAIDYLLEDDDLARIRNRGRSFRPLQRLTDDEISTAILWNFAGAFLALSFLGTTLFLVRRNRRPLV